MGARRRAPLPPLATVGAALAVALVAVPLAALVIRAPGARLWAELASAESVAAIRLSLVCSLGATVLSVGLGTPLAWVQARGEFRGRGALRALTTLPIVLPPVVGGVALLLAFGRHGLVGRWLDPLGIRLPFTTAGAVLAEAFVAMPFFVLTLEGGLRAVDPRLEEAARTLGASSWTTFRRVVLPTLAPAVISGTGLAFARAIGEYGSVVLIGGNIPHRTQVASQYIQEQIEIDRPVNAAAVSVALLAIAFLTLFVLRVLAGRSQRREEESP